MSFSPPAAWIAFSSNMKASLQGETFLISSRLIFLCPVTEERDVCCNQVLLSSFVEQPESTGNILLVLGASGDSVTNNFYGCNLYLTLRYFHLITISSGSSIVHLCRTLLFKLLFLFDSFVFICLFWGFSIML